VLDPNSSELKQLASILSSPDSSKVMPQVQYKFQIHRQNDDGRDPAKASGAQRDKTDVVVERYVCHALTYQGQLKMDLRIHFLVASVDLLIVLYCDGILRIGSGHTSKQPILHRLM
jgi:hypothetical protein